jgi:hypothetical protein
VTAAFGSSATDAKTAIREDVEYGGVRVRTTATIAGARIPIQVDVGLRRRGSDLEVRQLGRARFVIR